MYVFGEWVDGYVCNLSFGDASVSCGRLELKFSVRYLYEVLNSLEGESAIILLFPLMC